MLFVSAASQRKGDLLTLLIISPPAERKYVSHYERLEIDCGPLADAERLIGRRAWDNCGARFV